MRHVNYQVDGWIVGYELKINVDTRQISRETERHTQSDYVDSSFCLKGFILAYPNGLGHLI